jgi:hypothetical protein
MIDRLRASWEVQAAVAELDRTDPGWTFEEMQARRRNVPDEKNGALRVLAAAALLPNNWPAWDEPDPARELDLDMADYLAFATSFDDPDPLAKIDGEPLRVFRKELKRAEAAIPVALTLVDYLDGRFPIEYALDGVSTRFRGPNQARRVAMLLAAVARERIQEGDMSGAGNYVQATLHTARAIGEEYSFIPYLCRVSAVHRALVSMERLLAHGQVPDKQLRAWQLLLDKEDAEQTDLFLQAACGERALVHRAYQAYTRGELAFTELPRDLSKRLSAPEEEKRAAWDGLDEFIGVAGVYQKHALYLRHATSRIEAGKLPPGPREARFEALLNSFVGDRRLHNLRDLLPNIERVVNHCSFLQARLRCASAALAAERFRLEKGEWPASLNALLPHYLKEVPANPFDGQCLRVKRLPDGILIYSVGFDLVDNGGTLNRHNPTLPGSDVGFQLWDVDHRGRSAPAK